MQTRPPARRLATVASLVAMVATVAVAPASARPEGGSPPPPAARPAAPLTDVPPGAHELTLVTGDKVTLTVDAGGRYRVTVEGVARPDGSMAREFVSTTDPEGLYVFPDDVLPFVQAGALDRELFHVSYLAGHGYSDAETDQLPLIVIAAGGLSRAATLAGTSEVTELSSVGGAAVSVAKRDAGQFWQRLRGDEPGAVPPRRRALAAGVESVWLDRKLPVALADSVPLVGAPEAWDAGFDGSGVAVAVLDTGIDAAHPDVAGKVVAAENFTTEPSVADNHGHGTHVAATAAGTGAASGGQRSGIAPGADLLVGKVCDDGGGCAQSWIVAGMEWAAQEQGADVVNLSVGGCCSDGSDPVSQAVNNLTDRTGALFVIAAGNNGPAAGTIDSPGAADAALTVAATDKADDLAGFSGRGPRLDGALKPDLAAPGVGIVAARAAGTSLGSPVDAHYTAVSGTSMATPHVAGAAAVLAQQHPGWSPAALKAALMSTAADLGFTAYEQGAGRLDLGRAVRQGVYSTTANLDFGRFSSGDDLDPVTRELSYANVTGEAVTVAFDLTLRTVAGDPAPAGALTVADQTLTVPAGGTATTAVTLDPAVLFAGPLARYTGTVVATDESAGVRLTTPVGLDTRVRLTIRTLDRSGAPIAPQTTRVLPVELPGESAPTGAAGAPAAAAGDPVPAQAGTVSVLVEPGTYHIRSKLFWTGEDNIHNGAWLIEPELEVTSDTEITLDARDAVEVVFETPQPTLSYRKTVFVERTRWDGFLDGDLIIASVAGNWQERTWVTPTDEVATGTFRFSVQRDMSNPQLALRVRAPQRMELTPVFRGYGDHGLAFGGFINWGWVPFEGDQRLELVDAGYGRDEDLAGLDLAGKLALLRGGDDLTGDGFVDNCGRFSSRDVTYHHIQNIQDAGAVGLVLHGCPLPSLLLGPSDMQGTVQIPDAQIPPDQGEALAAMAAEGPVNVDVSGDPNLRYTYQLRVYEEQRIPDTGTYRFRHRDLARLDVSIPAPEPGPVEAREGWHSFKPEATASVLGATQFAIPRTRELYVGPIADDAYWVHSFNPQGGQSPRSQSGRRLLEPGTRTSEHWNLVPWTPGAVDLGPVFAVQPDSPFVYATCALCREGNTLWPYSYPTTGGGDHVAARFATEPALFGSDGTEIPLDPIVIPSPFPGFPPQVFPRFVLPEQDDTYRLVVDDAQFGVHTEWTFRSAAPDADRTPRGYACPGRTFFGWTDPCQADPFLLLDYHPGGAMRLDQTVPAPGVHRFTVTVGNPQRPDGPDVRGLDLSVSYDGGESWVPARVHPRGDGRFDVTVVYLPGRRRALDPVSLRAEAWDGAGNRVVQVIPHAWRLSPR